MDKQMDKQLTNKDFFFCYSKFLAAYIEENGIDYIVVAKNPKTNGTFTMFKKSKKLDEIIEQYNKERKAV